MARIRTIKPESFQDEKLGPLEPIHRLVWYGLIAQADDEGRLVDNLKIIDAFIFAHSDESSRVSLELLARMSRIARYTAPNGQKCIQIVRWKEHQRIDRPTPSRLPSPPMQVETHQAHSEARESLASCSRASSEFLATDLDQDHGSGSTATHTPASARERFILSLPVEKRREWDATLNAWLAGMDLAAGLRATDPDIESALGDFLRNGKGEPASRFLRKHVENAIRDRLAAESPPSLSRPNSPYPRRGRAADTAAEEAFYESGIAVGLIPIRKS